VTMVLPLRPPPQPTPSLGFTVSIMGATGGVLMASRYALQYADQTPPIPPTSEPLVILLRVMLGLVVAALARSAAKRILSPLVSLSSPPSGSSPSHEQGRGPPAHGRDSDADPSSTSTSTLSASAKAAEVDKPGPARHDGAADLLAKYGR
jgi:hypothetical protein